MTTLPIHDAAVRAWVADHVHRLFAPLRAHVGMDNPLAYGNRCGKRGAFLDKSKTPVPDGLCAMSGYREHIERWRHHKPPAARHWPRDPDDLNTHPGSDPAACPICKEEKR